MQSSAEVLAKNGLFEAEIDGFHARDIQVELAARIEETIAHGGIFVAESGTGTGKTYAYLVPALLSGKRVIFSTGTRHLQDQLFFRDLPKVQAALGVSPEVALLKGRANYLCLWRLGELGKGQPRGTSPKDLLMLKTALGEWAAHTRVGEIAEFSSIDEQDPLWREVTSSADNCLGGECPDFKNCFVNKARQRAMKARVVVVNHHLFFSDLTLKEAGFGELLPGHDVVVFDEAHQVPQVAARFFGFSVSTWQLTELAKDVQIAEAKEKSGVDFAAVLPALKKAVNEINLALANTRRGEAAQATQSPAGMVALNLLLDALAELETALSVAASKGEGLNRCHERCLQLQEYLLDWMEKAARHANAGEADIVCWFENNGRNTRLHATPVAVGKKMRPVLEQPDHAWILTSATLAAGEDFSLFTQQLGSDLIETAQFDSPFDYARNALLYLPQNLPEPNHPQYADAFVNTVLAVLRASHGRAFLLFTSYGMMHKVKSLLQRVSDWPLMMQGEAPRGVLIDRFRDEDEAVLLGTASFWEGVDIKGEDLSCVVIDKLPFAPPNDPVIASRLRAIQARGGNAFFDYQVPEAIISLKQGAGRLIRDESDRGVLVLCDARLTSKAYGSKFLDALPPMRRTQALADVDDFFAVQAGTGHETYAHESSGD